MMAVVYDLECWQAVFLCFLFAILYVGSLYIWKENKVKNRYMYAEIWVLSNLNSSFFSICIGFLYYLPITQSDLELS